MKALADVIRANRVLQERKSWCPAHPVPCTQRCSLRPQCKARPEKVMALIERLDAQTTLAMVDYVRRTRRA